MKGKREGTENLNMLIIKVFVFIYEKYKIGGKKEREKGTQRTGRNK